MNRREGLTAYILVACALLTTWASHAAESVGARPMQRVCRSVEILRA